MSTSLRRRRVILAATCLGTFMAILDTSLVNLGLHSIGRELGAGISLLQWVIDLYNLVYAAFILTAGTLCDLYGRRRIFVLGCLIFAAGSLVCALAPDVAVLIAGRGIAGLGAALELPAALAVLNIAFPDARERARAIAVWGGMNGLAMAVGPTLGGLIVDALGWRSLFYLILPVAAAATAFAARIPESRDPAGRHLDIPGQLCAVTVLATLALGFIEGPRLGWGSPWIIACFAVCASAAASFLVIERRTASPLVPLATFHSRPFSASILDATLMTFGMYMLLFVLPLYFQAIRHASAAEAGIALLPMSLTFFVVSLLAGRIATTAGPRLLIAGGMALTGGGLLGLSFLSAESSPLTAASSLVAIGVGLGLITGPISTVAVANAPAARSGMSSGLVNTGRLIGATLGVAVLGLLFGAEAGRAAADVAAFMAGLHTAFVTGALAQFLGALIAVLWLRKGSLESAPAAASA